MTSLTSPLSRDEIAIAYAMNILVAEQRDRIVSAEYHPQTDSVEFYLREGGICNVGPNDILVAFAANQLTHAQRITIVGLTFHPSNIVEFHFDTHETKRVATFR